MKTHYRITILLVAVVCTALPGCDWSKTSNTSSYVITTAGVLTQMNRSNVLIEGVAASYKGGTFGLILDDCAVGIEGRIPWELIGKTIRVASVLEITNYVVTAEDVRVAQQIEREGAQIAMPVAGTHKVLSLKSPRFE